MRCTVTLCVLFCLTCFGIANGQSTTAQVPKTAAAELRTDSFETKVKLLQAAWEQRDFDLARSLTHSLRDTVIQSQQEQQLPPESAADANAFYLVENLRPDLREWARGWKFFKWITLQESVGEARKSEPVEFALSFPVEQVSSLAREIRVASLRDGQFVELPSQVFHEVRRGGQRSCNVLILADSLASQQQPLFVFYGNPDAELPEYPSDLVTEGEGYGLDIANAHFKAVLSRQTGQLERLVLRREHGLELFSGGEGHGEPPGIDWAHDYVDEDNFQKLRISLWEECPDYEVVCGPLCTIVRRWGFPYSPIHPVYAPSRLQVDVEYRFYAGLPWFHKIGSMKAVQDFSVHALRDDEWVFSGQSFTHPLWMSADGRLHAGDVPAEHTEQLWGVGFYNQTSKDAFLALFLEHSAKGMPELKHTGAPLMYYRWHGSVWSRYPLPIKSIPSGAELRQKNAYVTVPFEDGRYQQSMEVMRRCLINPLRVTPTPNGTPLDRVLVERTQSDEVGTLRLGRPGESGEYSALKRAIWNALADCKDAQLYTADINVVELGLVYDVRVRGDVVTLVMAMPHRGRPRLGYFIDGSISVHPTLSVPIRERIMQVPGVRQVVFEQTWQPGWSTNRLTDEGRRKLGLD